MGFLAQDDYGSVTSANSYDSIAAFKAYHTDRGNDYSAFLDADIEIAMIKATDYLDVRFRYIGERYQGREQSTEWPRKGARDRWGNTVSGIPTEVKEATFEYALRALSGVLVGDPSRDATGGQVKSKAEAVGPISSSVAYALDGAFSMPVYPLADRKLKTAGLVVTGGDLRRS